MTFDLFFYQGFRCCYCYQMNLAKKQKQFAPKLEVPPPAAGIVRQHGKSLHQYTVKPAHTVTCIKPAHTVTCIKPAHAVTCIKRSLFACPVIENFI